MKSTYSILLFLLFLAVGSTGCEGYVSAPENQTRQGVGDSLALAKRIFRNSPQEAYSLCLRQLEVAEDRKDATQQKEIYALLSTLLFANKEVEEAYRYRLKQYELIRQTGTEEERLRCLDLLATLAGENGDYPAAMRYLYEILSKEEKQNKNRIYYRLALYLFKADSLDKAGEYALRGMDTDKPLSMNAALLVDIYNRQGRTEEAALLSRDQIARLCQTPNTQIPPIFLPLYRTYASYLLKKGKTQQAVDYMEEALTARKADISSSAYANNYTFTIQYEEARLEIHQQLDSLYTLRGETARVNDLLRHQLEAVQSLHNQRREVRMAELEKKYRVSELSLQAEKEKRFRQQTRSAFYIALTVVIFTLLLLASYVRWTARLRQKNRYLVKQLDEVTHLREDKMRVLIEQQSAAPDAAPVQSPVNPLFVKLEQYMEEQRPYTRPTLTRDELAAELNTNSTYLYKAIKESTGQGFSDYIASHRLQHACQLLRDKPGATIESIATDSGFASRQSFYRLFRKQFGLTPQEFRTSIS